MEHFARMALLADFYRPLLTAKQRRVWEFYYEQDLSLVEIAELENNTRQAVYDLLKRTEKILQGYEDKLGLVCRFKIEQDKVAEVNNLMQGFSAEDFSSMESWERYQAMLKEIKEIFKDI
ncbi:MAG: YlxM family DNA-binding protein [Desulfitobacterium sp.]|nr:YlxM family DNA-binding protein [Desulfitobacterium sp.]